MASSDQMLVQTESAFDLHDRMRGPVSRGAYIGNPDAVKGNSKVSNELTALHQSWDAGLDNLKRIAGDETVMPPVKHQNAEREANKLIAAMTNMETTMMQEAQVYHNRAAEIVADRFRLDPNRAFPDSKLHEHFEKAALKPDGPAIIRKLLDDIDYAKVFVTAKPEVLGLDATTFASLKAHAIRTHAPDAEIMSNDSNNLIDMTKHYAGLRERIPSAFYSAAILSRMGTRFTPN